MSTELTSLRQLPSLGKIDTTRVRLRKEGRLLIEEEITKEEWPSTDLVYISKMLESLSGDCLEFEVIIGEAGDLELYSPYDLARGGGVDLNDYVCIE